MSARLERALLLYHQGRYDLAEKEARLALAGDPDDPVGHAVLSQCLTGQEKYAEATDEAERAVGLGPDVPLAHFALAAARHHRNHYPEAEAAAREAIRLDPADPDHHAMLAAVRAAREDWRGALAAADRGLEQDAEHAWCGNLRAMALVKLGRQAEAGATMEEALTRDPDDAFTHANRGWGLLHVGDPRRALEHFREALRLEPNLDFARAGMIEALKARYWLYRQVLGYFLWIARLSPQARWGVVLGLFALQQVVASVARSNPALRPVLEPLLIGYVAFALTTWTAVPLSNLFLRLNRFGRYALSAEQRRASNWVAGFVAVALAGVGWGVFAPAPYDWPGWLTALAFMILLMPTSAVYACEPGWPRAVMILVTAGMFVLAASGSALFALGFYLAERAPEAALGHVQTGAALLRANTWAGLGSMFLANYLAGVRPRR